MRYGVCLLCQVLAGQIRRGPRGIRKRLRPSEASLPSGFLQVEGPETDLPLAFIYSRNPKLACTPGTIPQEHA